MTSMDTLRSRMPAEQLYLHFDKPYYHSGDTMWFKAYLLDAFLNLSSLSGLIYVELSAEQNTVLKRMVLPAAGGLARGQLALDEKAFPTGNYTLRAYTNLMRNFGESLVFKKQFYIARPTDQSWMVQSRFGLSKEAGKDKVNVTLQFNQFNKAPIGLQEMQLRLLSGKKTLYKDNFQTQALGRLETSFILPKEDNGPFTLVATDMRKGAGAHTLNIPVAISKQIDLQFMPEGGNLVSGIKSLVGFKAIDQNGKEIAVKGKIYNSANQEVASFESLHQGMGRLELLPRFGERYTAKLSGQDGAVSSYPLPEVKNTGTVLQVSNSTSSDSIEVQIQASPDLLAAGGNYYLIGQSRGVACYGALNKLKNETINIPKSAFPSGIARLTLLNSSRQPLNERMVYIDHQDNLKIEIIADKPVYTTRDSIALSIKVTDHTDRPIQGSFSLSVTDDQQIRADLKGRNTMASYLLLSSGLQGTVENPDEYFQPGNNPLALDNLLLTQGWTGYSWKDVFAPPKTLAYSAELEYTVQGKVESITKPIPGTQVMLISKKPSLLMETQTDSLGRFIFKDLVPADSAVFLIQAKNRKGKNFNVGVAVDEFRPPVFSAAKQQLSPWYVNTDSALLSNLLMASNLQKEQDRLTGKNMLTEVTITAKKVVKGSKNLNGPGEADLVLDEEDMIKAGKMTLLDLLKENVKGFGIMYKRHIPNYAINFKRVRLVIDGIDVNLFWDQSSMLYKYLNTYLTYYTAEDILGIELMYNWTYNSTYRSSVLSFEEMKGSPSILDYAFIEITTRSGAGPFLKHEPGTYLLRPLTLTMPKEFYRPRYVLKGNTGIQDFRSTIHWEPDIITNVNGKATVSFYAADNPGSYSILLEGCSTDGSIGTKLEKININLR